MTIPTHPPQVTLAKECGTGNSAAQAQPEHIEALGIPIWEGSAAPWGGWDNDWKLGMAQGEARGGDAIPSGAEPSG